MRGKLPTGESVDELRQAMATSLLCGRFGLRDDIMVASRDTVTLTIPSSFAELDGQTITVRLEVGDES